VYPDGVAAVALGRAFRKPVVLTARGSDVTLFPQFAGPRRMIRWAMAEAAGLIAVSAGLKQAMVELGASPLAISVLRNGVDLHKFRPLDPSSVREEWKLSGPVLLSVGHLIERKGHHLAIEALTGLPGWTLAIVGEGPERGRLEELVRRLGLSGRVVFCGAQPHSTLARFYSAADVLILASSREGWANVLLEAMACGTPVVASNIPGNPEVVRDRAAGSIVAHNTAECFAATIRELQASRPSREATRSYAEDFGWESTTAGQLELFRRVLAGR
jgi:teichuronic acid biosynthesis glycosyltransferase TuaC